MPKRRPNAYHQKPLNGPSPVTANRTTATPQGESEDFDPLTDSFLIRSKQKTNPTPLPGAQSGNSNPQAGFLGMGAGQRKQTRSMDHNLNLNVRGLPSFVPGVLSTTAILLISVMLLLGTLTYHQSTAFANGSTRPVVKNERVGPYDLQVGILPGTPRVGNLHFSVLVNNAEVGEPITDALVTIAASGPQNATSVGPVRALNTPLSPQFYEVDVPLDMEGRWTFTLEVVTDLGEESLELPMEVSRPGGFSVAFVAAVAIALLAVSIWTWDRIRRRRHRRRQSV